MPERPIAKVFLSYASEQERDVAAVAVCLRARGYAPFFDRSSISGGQSPEVACHSAVDACDLFVFFVSPSSVAHGAYTLTELEWAKRRWNDPAGHVLPILVQDTDISTVDPYLTQLLNIACIRGNFAIGVCDLVDGLLRPRAPRWRGLSRRACDRVPAGADYVPAPEGQRASNISLPPVTGSRMPRRVESVPLSAGARRAASWLLFGGVLTLGLMLPLRLRERPGDWLIGATPRAADPLASAPPQPASGGAAATMPSLVSGGASPFAVPAGAAAGATAQALADAVREAPVASPFQAAVKLGDASALGLVSSRPNGSGDAEGGRAGMRPKRQAARAGSAEHSPAPAPVLPPAAPPEARPAVRWVSAPTSLTSAERREVLARSRHHAAICQQLYPDSKGSKTYHVDVDARGNVQRLRRDNQSAISEPFAECMQAGIKLLRFSFNEREPMTLVFEVALR